MRRVPHRQYAVGALVLLVLAMIAGRGRPRLVATRPDPAVVLDAQGSVPAPVARLLRRACFDCHSEETRWPWYSRLPPGSWIVGRDVDAGRGQWNFSRWGEYNPYDRADLLDKACTLATKKKMPLWPYRLLHREARLADDEIAALCAWTRAEGDRLVQGGS